MKKKEKLYDVICSKSNPYSDTEPYERTVGTKLPLKEAQQAMLDDALSEIEYNGHIYVGKDGEEFEYIDYDNLEENVRRYLKRHSIGTSLNITQWDNEELDYSIVEHEEPAQKPATSEIWSVGWAEFDGWESELYAGSEVFKTKEEAIAWVENDYNTTLADKFDQDPDEEPDDHPELKLDPNKIEDNSTVEFPECENFYRKWSFNRSKV